MNNTGYPILKVSNLSKHYEVSNSWLSWLGQKQKTTIRAIDGIDFELGKGEILGLVGESGSGKSTTALTTMGLVTPTTGEVTFNGVNIHSIKNRTQLRQSIQMVFQDPYEALNPRQTVYQIVVEPLEVHKMAHSRSEKLEQVKFALDQAGLKPPDNFLNRYPDELSGGQRQRVIIAGALILRPQILIADEPVSMLDVSIRAEILNLLKSLREKHNISILYITHDLATAAFFTDRIAVMYLGKIIEIGTTQDILQNPQHPYTKALISVIPVPNPRLRRKREILQGEIPNPGNIPSGCRFHPRCPIAINQCKAVSPLLEPVTAYHQSACINKSNSS